MQERDLSSRVRALGWARFVLTYTLSETSLTSTEKNLNYSVHSGASIRCGCLANIVGTKTTNSSLQMPKQALGEWHHLRHGHLHNPNACRDRDESQRKDDRDQYEQGPEQLRGTTGSFGLG